MIFPEKKLTVPTPIKKERLAVFITTIVIITLFLMDIYFTVIQK